MFRGRERQYLDRGRAILDRVAKELDGVGIVESPPRFEGHFMSMIMTAKKTAGGDKPAPPPQGRREPGGSSGAPSRRGP
jgi:translation initiation factor IF-3